MKSLRLLAPVLVGALALAGCGDGSVKSPTFTPVLLNLSIAAPDATVDSMDATRFVIALGDSTPVVATGIFSAPPGGSETEGEVADASFDGSPDGRVSFEGGELVAESTGTVTISASKDGVDSDNTLTFRIVAPVLQEIVIDPPEATISQFETQTFTATGNFTDADGRPLDVMWTVDGPATLSNSSGNMTTLTPNPGSAGGTATLTATFETTDENGNPITVTETATVTINNDAIVDLTAVVPSNSTVTPDGSVDFTARGTFSDGTNTRTGNIPDGVNGFVDWTSSNPAEVPINGDTGVVAAGTTTAGQTTLITGTLRGAVTTAPGAQRSASTNLSITDARCTTPLLGAAVGGNAVTSEDINDTCIGCSVSNEDDVIDGDIDTFGTIALTLGLLNTATATLNIDGTTTFDDTRAGFVVAKPAGLLSAELLNSLAVSTRLNGVVVEAAGDGQATALNVTALGAISLSGQEAFLVSFVATQPFNGLALSFNGGVLSLLPTVNVFQACGTATDTSNP